jgi:hypothetical protein
MTTALEYAGKYCRSKWDCHTLSYLYSSPLSIVYIRHGVSHQAQPSSSEAEFARIFDHRRPRPGGVQYNLLTKASLRAGKCACLCVALILGVRNNGTVILNQENDHTCLYPFLTANHRFFSGHEPLLLASIWYYTCVMQLAVQSCRLLLYLRGGAVHLHMHADGV